MLSTRLSDWKVREAENDFLKVRRSFNPTEGKRGGSTKDPVKILVANRRIGEELERIPKARVHEPITLAP